MFQTSAGLNINIEKSCGWDPGPSTDLVYFPLPHMRDLKMSLDRIFTVPVGCLFDLVLCLFPWGG